MSTKALKTITVVGLFLIMAVTYVIINFTTVPSIAIDDLEFKMGHITLLTLMQKGYACSDDANMQPLLKKSYLTDFVVKNNKHFLTLTLMNPNPREKKEIQECSVGGLTYRFDQDNTTQIKLNGILIHHNMTLNELEKFEKGRKVEITTRSNLQIFELSNPNALSANDYVYRFSFNVDDGSLVSFTIEKKFSVNGFVIH